MEGAQSFCTVYIVPANVLAVFSHCQETGPSWVYLHAEILRATVQLCRIVIRCAVTLDVALCFIFCCKLP